MRGRWRNFENTQSEKAIVGSDSPLLTLDSTVTGRTQEAAGGLVLATIYMVRSHSGRRL
jgi:hypothetical protein